MDFSEKFSVYSNTDLLRIIENPNDFQSQAVETAKTIILERQLSETEIKIAEKELEAERQQNLKQEQQGQIIAGKVRNLGKSVSDLINPIQEEAPTSKKTINTVSILLGALFLFSLYKRFGMIMFMFTDSRAEWGFETLLSFMLTIAFPTAIILFYFRKKAGWLLLTIYLIYAAGSTVGQFIIGVSVEPSGIEGIDHLIPQIRLMASISVFLFWTVIIRIICRDKIRVVYAVSRRAMTLTISMASLVVAIGVFIILAWQ